MRRLDGGEQGLLWAALAAISVLLVPSNAAAQALYGSIDGNVWDPSNAAIAGATVTITNTLTNQSRQTITNTAGGYDFANAQPGTYEVRVSAPGFQTFVRTDVRVTIDSIIRVDVRLQLGAVSDTVTVAAEAAVLQTDRSDVRHEVNTKELENIPVPTGRNYQHLFRTLPGFSAPQDQPVRASNPAESLNMNVNGTSAVLNNTRIDGASAMNLQIQQFVAYVPALEAIDTVEVATNSFDAEQGLAGGAAINVHIKSGGNQVHGSGFEYTTNNRIKARPFFFPPADKKPKFLFNQFGGTIGGPIKQNTLFYFLSYEGTTDRRTVSRFATAPTTLAKTGDFSEASQPIYDPLTGDGSGANRRAFSNNIIPPSRQSSISRKIVPLWPEPNRPGFANNYFVTAPFPFTRHNADTKFNWNASPKLSVFGRFSVLQYNMFYEQIFDAKLGGPAVGGGQVGGAWGGVYSLTTAGTYLFTPNFIVDAYFGYTRMDQNVEQPRLDENVGRDFLGIPGTNGSRRFEGGWPRIVLDGLDTVGVDAAFMPWYRHDPLFNQAANFNWTNGSHNIRFGGELSLKHLNQTQAELGGQVAGASGGFQFTSGVTQLRGGPSGDRSNSFASFLLGLPQSLGRGTQVSDVDHTRARLYSLYLRDRWNVTPRLTLNYGVRWEYFPFPTRADRGFEFYDLDMNRTLICGFKGIPRDCGVSESKRNFAPRVGLALRATDNFVIRAGYGISIDPYILYRWLRTNYPMIIALTVQGPNALQPAGRLEDGIPPVLPPDFGNGIIVTPPTAFVTAADRVFRRGYIQSWNFTLQRKLKYGFVGQVGYVATRQTRQLGQVDLNAGQLIGAGQAGRPLFSRFGRTAATYRYGPLGTGQYNSLQAQLERRFSQGLHLVASYTWSKAIAVNSNSEEAPQIQALQYFNLNRAPVNYDRTHTLHITNVWELPLGKGRRWVRESGVASAVLGGWQVNNVLSFMTGLPFTVVASGTSLDLPGSTQRADQVKPSVMKLGGAGPGQSFFDPLAFAAVIEARLGTAGFNSLRGPGVVNWDLGAFREFPLTERWKLQFRTEAFNFSNTPHFSNPGNNVSNMLLNRDGTIRSLGGFSEITSVNASGVGRTRADERNFRFGLRLSF